MGEVPIGAVRRARGVTRRSLCAAILATLAFLGALLVSVAVPAARAQTPGQPTLDEVSVVGPNGPPGADDSTEATVSADGRFVAFSSQADNLPGGIAGEPSTWIYIHDRVTHATTRISPANPVCGDCGGGPFAPSLSSDATRVAYTTGVPYAGNLAGSSGVDNNDSPDVYYQDITHDPSGAITSVGPPVLVSALGSPSPLAVGGREPSLSGDGRWLAFSSDASFGYTLCCQPGNVFLADLTLAQGTQPKLVSRSRTGAGMTGSAASDSPSVSATGAYVAFTSRATDLIPGPGYLDAHVYRWARDSGAIVDVAPGEARALRNPAIGGLDPEGTRVALEVSDQLHVEYDCNVVQDGVNVVFDASCPFNPMKFHIENLTAWPLTITSVSVGNGFSVADGVPPCQGATIPPGQECVLVVTAPAPTATQQETDLVINHGAGSPMRIHLVVPPTSGPLVTTTTTSFPTDVLLSTLTSPSAPVIEWVSERIPCPAAIAPCPRPAINPALSADGSTLAWQSRSGDFVAGDDADSKNIFVRDLKTGPTGSVAGPIRRIAPPYAGEEMDYPALSRDGGVVAFQSGPNQGSAAALPGPAAFAGPTPPPTLGPPMPASFRSGAAKPQTAAPSKPAAPAASAGPASPMPHIAPPLSASGVFQVYAADYGASPTATVPNFGSVPVNQTGPTQTITITNNDSGPMTITGVTSSAPGEFQIVPGGTCVPNMTLHQGQSCTIKVAFHPTALGNRTATIAVAYQNGFIPASLPVSVSGTGIVAPVVAINPTSLDFGTVPVGQGSALQTVTITNHSGGTVPVAPPAITGDFAVGANTCGSSLADNATCTVTLIFAPTTTGTRSGVLTLTFGGQVFTVPLTGNGSAAQPAAIEITPNPLTWGEVTVGVASAPKDLTIKNTGAGPLNIASVAVTTGGSEYKITGDGCTGKSLANGQSCTVTLVFTPSALGDRAGELTVLSNVGTTKATLGGKGVTFAVNVDPNPVDFGSVAVNEESPEKIVTITIPGVAAPPNGSFSITGPNASEFHINSRECSAALPDGTKCTVRLGFKPTDVGERSATLQGTFGPSQTPFSVALKGAGGVPVPSIEPNPVDFGSVLLGAVSAETTATVANKGDGKLTPGVAGVTGANVADFTFVADNCNGKTLLRDQSCTIVLRFGPASAGARSASLNVPGVGSVDLTGTGTTPGGPTAPPPGGGGTTPTTAPGGGGGTTPTTAPGGSTTPTTVPAGPSNPAATPTIRLSRPLGAPGEVITIEGTGFRPNTQVTLRWLLSPLDPQGQTIVLTTVTTDAAGSFPATPAVIFVSDPAGPRVAEASGGPDQTASAPFLVVPATMQRSDNEALNSRRTQLLYRR